MSAKIKYTNESVKARVVRDFLPRPEQLAFREGGVKVTLSLSRKSVAFFKSEAAKHHTRYQRMIAGLLIPMWTPMRNRQPGFQHGLFASRMAINVHFMACTARVRWNSVTYSAIRYSPRVFSAEVI